MKLNKVEKIAEAVLFASGEPVSAARMAQVLECDIPVAYSVLDRLRDHYDEEDLSLIHIWMGAQSPVRPTLSLGGKFWYYTTCQGKYTAKSFAASAPVRRHPPPCRCV